MARLNLVVKLRTSKRSRLVIYKARGKKINGYGNGENPVGGISYKMKWLGVSDNLQYVIVS